MILKDIKRQSRLLNTLAEQTTSTEKTPSTPVQPGLLFWAVLAALVYIIASLWIPDSSAPHSSALPVKVATPPGSS